MNTSARSPPSIHWRKMKDLQRAQFKACSQNWRKFEERGTYFDISSSSRRWFPRYRTLSASHRKHEAKNTTTGLYLSSRTEKEDIWAMVKKTVKYRKFRQLVNLSFRFILSLLSFSLPLSFLSHIIRSVRSISQRKWWKKSTSLFGYEIEITLLYIYIYICHRDWSALPISVKLQKHSFLDAV